MLYLYDKDTREFSRNGIPLHDAYDAHVIREEGFYLKFKMLLNGQYKSLKKEMIISAMTPSGYNQFRIFDINPHSDHIEVVALHLFYYLDNRLVRPFELKRVNGKVAIQSFVSRFVSNIEPYTFDSSVTEVHDFQSATTESENDRYQNALEVINRIATRWDSEFELNGFDVRMVKRLGRRTNALLYEKKNIAEFEEESTIRNLVTRIHATSKWTIGHDEPGYVQDGNNEREIKVIVDSPLVDHYSQIYEVQYVNNDCRTEKELGEWAKLKYSTHHLDKPKRNIKVKTNIIDGTEINLGDELVLKYLVHDIDEVIRCVGYDYDPLGKTYYEVTLGDWRQSFGDTVHRATADISDRQISQIETLKKHVQIVQMKADGIGRVTYGPNPVPNPRHGDIWYFYSLDRPDEIILRVWDGELGDWKEIPLDNSELIKKVEDVEAKAQEMESRIAESDEKVKQALETAKVNKSLAEEAQRVSEITRRDFISSQVDLAAYYNRVNNLSDRTNQLVTDVSGILETVDGLNSTVTRTILDKKTGLLTRLQNEQRQTAEALKSKLSGVDVNRLIDGKNLLSISQYTNDRTETSRGIEQKFSEIRSSIPNEIGGRNYVRDSAVMKKGNGRWDTGTFRHSGSGTSSTVDITDFPNRNITKAIKLIKNGAGNPGITQDHFDLNAGDWTLSWWVKAPIGTQFRIQAYWSDNNKQTGIAPNMTSRTNDWQRIHFTTTNTVEGNSSIAYIYLVSGSEMLVTAPKLEKGRILTDWSPAPEDNKIDREAFSSMQRTASLVEQIFGSTDQNGALTNLSRQVLTSSIFQTEVGKYMVQKQNLVYAPTKLTKYISSISDNKHLHGVLWSNRSGIRIKYVSDMNGLKGVMFPLTKRIVQKDEVWSYRFEMAVDEIPTSKSVLMQIVDNTDDRNILYSTTLSVTRTGNQVFKGTFRFEKDSELNEYALRFTLNAVGNIVLHRLMFVEGDIQPEYFYDSTDYNGEYLRTQVSQISDSWAVRLLNSSGDILSQLNLNSGGVKIQGKLINLDGSVSMNDAFVKKLIVDTASVQTLTAFSAKIANLVAVNIDASKITTNMISAIEGAFRSSNGSVDISRNTITINTGGSTNMELNQHGLHYNDQSSRLIGWIGQASKGGTLNISVSSGKELALGYMAGREGGYRNAMVVNGSTGEIDVQNKMIVRSGMYPTSGSRHGLQIVEAVDAIWLIRTDRSSGIVFYNNGNVAVIKNSLVHHIL